MPAQDRHPRHQDKQQTPGNRFEALMSSDSQENSSPWFEKTGESL